MSRQDRQYWREQLLAQLMEELDKLKEFNATAKEDFTKMEELIAKKEQLLKNMRDLLTNRISEIRMKING